jgi:hypothetical protein
MSAHLTEVNGKVLTMRISGILKQTELLASQQEAAKWIESNGTASLLIILDQFEGTAQEGDWSDFSFQMKYDPMIEKIAIVCEPQWRDAAFMFTGKGLRPMPIQHFLPAELDLAVAWAEGE